MFETTTSRASCPVCEAPSAERIEFLKKTYLHLAVAILVFASLCGILLETALPAFLLEWAARSGFAWLMILLIFSAIGSFGQKLARSGAAPEMQYLGIGVYVLTEAVIVSPLLYLAILSEMKSAIFSAGLITLSTCFGVFMVVFFIKRDFTFMKGALATLGAAAVGLIVASLIFGFDLGSLFSFGMVLLAGGYLLYHTSNIFQNYPSTAYVAAALDLFSSLSLLFWYVLQLLMKSRRR